MITTSEPDTGQDAATDVGASAGDDHGRPRGRRVQPVLAVVAVVALAAGGYQQSQALRRDSALQHDRRAVVAAARAEVLALTTVSSKTSDADVARLLDGATAGFKSQFQQQATAFTQALRDGQVTSTGTIASAGLQSLKAGQAVVLVAATGTVKNKASAKGEVRNYRLQLTMTKSGGRWLVSGMEFVA